MSTFAAGCLLFVCSLSLALANIISTPPPFRYCVILEAPVTASAARGGSVKASLFNLEKVGAPARVQSRTVDPSTPYTPGAPLSCAITPSTTSSLPVVYLSINNSTVFTASITNSSILLFLILAAGPLSGIINVDPTGSRLLTGGSTTDINLYLLGRRVELQSSLMASTAPLNRICYFPIFVGPARIAYVCTATFTPGSFPSLSGPFSLLHLDIDVGGVLSAVVEIPIPGLRGPPTLVMSSPGGSFLLIFSRAMRSRQPLVFTYHFGQGTWLARLPAPSLTANVQMNLPSAGVFLEASAGVGTLYLTLDTSTRANTSVSVLLSLPYSEISGPDFSRVSRPLWQSIAAISLSSPFRQGVVGLFRSALNLVITTNLGVFLFDTLANRATSIFDYTGMNVQAQAVCSPSV